MWNSPGKDNQYPDNPPPEELPIEHQCRGDTKQDAADNGSTRKQDCNPDRVPYVWICQKRPVIPEGQSVLETESDHSAVGQADPKTPDQRCDHEHKYSDENRPEHDGRKPPILAVGEFRGSHGWPGIEALPSFRPRKIPLAAQTLCGRRSACPSADPGRLLFRPG